MSTSAARCSPGSCCECCVKHLPRRCSRYVLQCYVCPNPLQKRYKPFPMSAVTTRHTHSASQSSFKDVERVVMRLLLRCMGVEVCACAG